MSQQVIKPILLTDAAVARFWSKIALPDASGCMLWTAGKMSDGYGQFTVKPHYYRAHRVACFLAYGDPPPGSPYAVHGCRNRHCVAPEHLRWATSQINHEDMRRDGTVPVGEQHGRAKLTDDAVREIRASADSIGLLARRYGVDRATIRCVQKQSTWTHVR